MTFKEIKPKYEDLEIYFEKENMSLLEVPQKTKYDFALSMYAERKVIMEDNHDDRKVTEIWLENEQQYKKRKNFTI